MKKKLILSIALILSAILFVGCKKSNQETNLSITFKMKSTNASLTKVTPTIVFDSGYVRIKKVEFEGTTPDSGKIELEQNTFSIVNLVTGNSSPKIILQIPVGEYSDVEFKVKLDGDDNNYSIVAYGSYTDASGNTTPILFQSNEDFEFEVEAGSFTFTETTNFDAVVDFSPASWFANIPASMLDNAQRVNGVIVINENTNPDIYDKVNDYIDDIKEANFEEDHDMDHDTDNDD